MKPEALPALLVSVETRARLEQSRLAALRAAEGALLREAAALETRARGPAAPGPCEDMAALERHQRFLERAARAKRLAAAEMAPAIRAQEARLQASLGREIACRRLADAAALVKRKAANEREEETREALVRQ